MIKLSPEVLAQKIRERQARVKTATIEWTQERFIASGAMIIPVMVDGKRQAKRWPEKDETFESKHRFSFDEKRTRHWSSEFSRGPQGNVTINETLNTYDGERTRTLTSPTRARNYFYGQIYSKEDTNRELSVLDIEPLLDCFHLFQTSWKLTARDSLNVDPSDPDIDGVTCVVASISGEATTHRFWIDPNRDCVIVRSSMQDREVVCRQTDFSYRKDIDHGWVLDGWNIKVYDAFGKINHSYAAKVIKTSKVNPQFLDSEFTIAVPLAAYDHDWGNGTEYILLADGQQRKILANEKSVPYEDLLQTESGKAQPRPERNDVE